MITQWLTPLIEWLGVGDLITLCVLIIAVVAVIKLIKD